MVALVLAKITMELEQIFALEPVIAYSQHCVLYFESGVFDDDYMYLGIMCNCGTKDPLCSTVHMLPEVFMLSDESLVVG